MADLNFSIDNEQVRELFQDAIREEAIKACKHALADNDIRQVTDPGLKSRGLPEATSPVVERKVNQD